MSKEEISNIQIRRAVLSATNILFKGHRNWKRKVPQDFEWRIEKKIREIIREEESYTCEEA